MSARGLYREARQTHQAHQAQNAVNRKKRSRRCADSGALKIRHRGQGEHDLTSEKEIALKAASGWVEYEVIAPQRLSAMEKAGKIGPMHGPLSTEFGPKDHSQEPHSAAVVAELTRVGSRGLLTPEGLPGLDLLEAYREFAEDSARRVRMERQFVRTSITVFPSFPCHCDDCCRL